MFKSVFAKYETAFMTIITFGFAILLLIVTSIVSNYSKDRRFDDMQSVAEVGGAFVQTVADRCEGDFEGEWKTFENRHFAALLQTYVTEQSLSFCVLDANGRVLSAVDSVRTPQFAQGSVFPHALPSMSNVEATVSFFTLSDCKTEVCLLPIYDGEAVCAWIAVASFETFWGHMAQDLSKTVISAAFLVLLATMIAAYIITTRTTDPLREMSSAARSFAAGNFEARVKVRGRDEVSELAEAFNQMADSLENLENMRNSFIANVSHDLRTPMTTIAGFIDGIRDGVIPPEEAGRYLDLVSGEVHRLSRLVSALLDISRIQAGDRKFVCKPFDICEMARLILISFEASIEQKHLDVSFECSPERLTVNADRDAIYQVFYNVCHNAVKFSREEGALRISIEETRGKKVTVSVYNEGQGIPSEELGMVFERFYKSDKSRGLDKTGTGLGMFISKAIITAHGERIWVESEFGKDCRFSFTLPQATSGLLHAVPDTGSENR